MNDAAAPDRYLFNLAGVVITREIANIKGTSYPINGIGSVRVATPNRVTAFLIGVGLCIISIVTKNTESSGFWIWFVAGAVAFWVAYSKPYTLIIHTSSSDRPALTGKKDFLLSVKDAIENAVTLRG